MIVVQLSAELRKLPRSQNIISIKGTMQTKRENASPPESKKT